MSGSGRIWARVWWEHFREDLFREIRGKDDWVMKGRVKRERKGKSLLWAVITL